MTLSECDNLAETLPAASSRPAAAFVTLTLLMQSHHHSNRTSFHASTLAHPKPFSVTVTVTERLFTYQTVAWEMEVGFGLLCSGSGATYIPVQADR